MLALHTYRAGRCPGCGGDLEITTAPESEDRFRRELPLTCHRCVAFDLSHKAYEAEPHPQALLHLVPPRPS